LLLTSTAYLLAHQEHSALSVAALKWHSVQKAGHAAKRGLENVQVAEKGKSRISGHSISK